MSPAVRFERICDVQLRAGNREWVEQQRDAAMTKIAAGGGIIRVVVSGTVNGKIVGADILLNALDVADIAQSAIDEEDGTNSSATGLTFLDFSGMHPRSRRPC